MAGKIGIAVASNREWKAAVEFFGLSAEQLTPYPYGEHCPLEVAGNAAILFHCGGRKVKSASAAQYIIDHFQLESLLVVGTCAGIAESLPMLALVSPHTAGQYDTTLEGEPLLREQFLIPLKPLVLPGVRSGVLGTGDKVILSSSPLRENGVTIGDCEGAAIAYVCRCSGIPCAILKGVSDIPSPEAADLAQQTLDYNRNTAVIMREILGHCLEEAVRQTVQ